MKESFYVYFMTNYTNKVLYTGMTSDLEKRVWEHKLKVFKGFTKRYNAGKLVYCEVFSDPENAIEREKQIKNWSRKKKDFLVNKMNPEWKDLALEWYQEDPPAFAGVRSG